jgi:hypothetical protein
MTLLGDKSSALKHLINAENYLRGDSLSESQKISEIVKVDLEQARHEILKIENEMKLTVGLATL